MDSQWCGEHGVAIGILRRPSPGQKLRPATVRANRLFSSIRCKIEKAFALVHGFSRRKAPLWLVPRK
jgi:hypothetical protein